MTRMQMRTKIGGVLWIGAAMMAGCEKTPIEDQAGIPQAELQGVSSASANTSGGSSGSSGGAGGWTSSGTSSGTSGVSGMGASTGSLWSPEITGTVKFLHTDVSSWPVTASLSAHVGGGAISMPYSKTKVWPSSDGVNANPWVFVNQNGQWYAATFEYLRSGQTSKPMGVLDGSMGDHIKVSPLSGWDPHSGERIGIMVSGLARGGLHNVKERSNVSMVTWP